MAVGLDGAWTGWTEVDPVRGSPRCPDRSRKRRESEKKLRVPLDAIFGVRGGSLRRAAAPPTLRERLRLRGRGSARLSGVQGADSSVSRARKNLLFAILWYTYEYG